MLESVDLFLGATVWLNWLKQLNKDMEEISAHDNTNYVPGLLLEFWGLLSRYSLPFHGVDVSAQKINLGFLVN